MLLQPFLVSALGGLAYLSQGVSAMPADTPDLSLESRGGDPGFFSVTSPKPDGKDKFKFGDTIKITWQKSSKYTGTFALGLIGGPTQTGQIPLGQIAASVKHSDGSYSWKISEKFVGMHSWYGLTAYSSEPSAFQYSPPFQIAGGPTSGGTDKDVEKPVETPSA